MKLGTSARYGLVAVGYIAENAGKGRVTSSVIAKEYRISELYMVKIMQQLANANILSSKRGPKGGFSLARPTTEINMLEIIEATEGISSFKLELVQTAISIKLEEICEQASDKAASILRKAKLSQMMK